MVDPPLLAAAVLGTLAGAAVGLGAGLVPGLHANNLSQGLVALRLSFVAALGVAVSATEPGGVDPQSVFGACGFLFGVTLGHAFTDEIPAVLLGAPGPDTALSVLPGHRLLMEGHGASAVRAAALGSLLGILMSMPLLPVLVALMGAPLHLYAQAAGILPVLLLAVAGAVVLSERGSKELSRSRARLLAVGLLLLSAALGEAVIFRGTSLPSFYPIGPPSALASGHLLALFAGLFGLPTLLIAARTSVTPTPAAPGAAHLPLARRQVARAAAVGTLAGAAVGWLPGVGAAQASVLAKIARDRWRRKPDDARGKQPLPDAADFLVTQSAVAAANLVFNLAALFALLRIRSGTMSAVSEVGGVQVGLWEDLTAPPALFLALVAGMIVALPLCYAAALWLGTACARGYMRMPPRALAGGVLVALLALIFTLEGTLGLAIAAAAILLGLVPPLAGVKRVHLMGAILVPVAVRLLVAG